MDGQVISYEDLKNGRKDKFNEIKRLLVFDQDNFEFFMILNIPKRRFIRCINSPNSIEVNGLLRDVNQLLEKNKIKEGNFRKHLMKTYSYVNKS